MASDQEVSGDPIASTSPTEATQDQSTDIAPSTASIDSETVLLNPASKPVADTESPRPTPQRSNTDLKQCWICYVDETEDTPTTSRWRSPCPCALVAHESCLLDWVADLEAPGSSRTKAPKIQCPQCKKDIIIARPTSYVVQATKAVERFGSRLVVPGIVFTLGASVYTGATMHGILSTFVVFGRQDFEKILGSPQIPPKWLLSFPFVPVALILSRTGLADQILPSVPLLLWATGLPQAWGGYPRPLLWPPTPQMAFAALPFIRSVYRQSWKALFAKKEAEWTKQVKPRAGEGTETNDGAAENVELEGDENDIFNFQVEILDQDDEIQPDAVDEPAVPIVAVEVEENPPNNDAPPAQAANPNAGAGARQQARGLTLSGAYIADVVMGALAFPAIASIMGELLRLGLPASWISTNSTYVLRLGLGAKQPFPTLRTPFLASQWARSLVGGCLFVVMKDTLLLYAKYRTARDHRKRRVCNWDKTLGRIVD